MLPVLQANALETPTIMDIVNIRRVTVQIFIFYFLFLNKS